MWDRFRLSRLVEPVEFLYCLMFTTSNIVRDNLFQDKVCRLDFGYPEEVCRNLTSEVRASVLLTCLNFYTVYNHVLHAGRSQRHGQDGRPGSRGRA